MKTTKATIANRLGEVPLFERCSQRDLKTIARHVEVITIAADQMVVEEGTSGDAFFVVLDGKLDVVRNGSTAAELRSGHHFGELALLDPAPRSATVITRTDVTVGVLTVRMFRVLLRDMPQIAERLLASLAGQLRHARSVS